MPREIFSIFFRVCLLISFRLFSHGWPSDLVRTVDHLPFTRFEHIKITKRNQFAVNKLNAPSNTGQCVTERSVLGKFFSKTFFGQKFKVVESVNPLWSVYIYYLFMKGFVPYLQYNTLPSGSFPLLFRYVRHQKTHNFRVMYSEPCADYYDLFKSVTKIYGK